MDMKRAITAGLRPAAKPARCACCTCTGAPFTFDAPSGIFPGSEKIAPGFPIPGNVRAYSTFFSIRGSENMMWPYTGPHAPPL